MQWRKTAWHPRRTGSNDSDDSVLNCSKVRNMGLFIRLQEGSAYGWHLETRRLLRFTARIVNQGNADFRPAIPKHMWQFHACHM